MEIFQEISIVNASSTPKYRQIVDSIIQNISDGNLKFDQKIPSINTFSEEYYLSRDTVEKAYSILKERKIIKSIRGKGYYVSQTPLISKTNILFLVNKLSSYKLKIYNHFTESMGQNSHTDLHVYHCDESIFLNLLEKNKNAYDYYVIMPHFKTEDSKHASFTENVLRAIKGIPSEKLIILDNSKPDIGNNIIEVYQDFENDIYNALNEGLSKINKYNKIFLIYPENAIYPYPRRILHGFRKFCIEQKINFEILNEINEQMTIEKGSLYITIEESDLVNLVKKVKENGFKPGFQIGIISYNDTPLKELLGVTVISTDFKVMGETVSKMILNKQKGKVKVPFYFIDRHST